MARLGGARLGGGTARLGKARQGTEGSQKGDWFMAKKTDVHPLDFGALQKGETIPKNQLEKIFGVREVDDPRRFDREMLNLRTSIQQLRPELDVVQENYSLHVRTDAETVDKTAWRLKKQRRDVSRARQKIAAVNPDKLSELEQRTAEKLHMAVSVRELQLREQQRKLDRELRLLNGNEVRKLE
jgi:hypothetical protein